MREIRQPGSEGAGGPASPYPYHDLMPMPLKDVGDRADPDPYHEESRLHGCQTPVGPRPDGMILA
jgi:hypothetical protein